MKRTGLWRVVAALGTAGVAAALSAAIVVAQAPAAGGHHESAAEPGTMPMCAMMTAENMADQKAMMAKMALADQKLDELLAKMNTATGDQKVAAIAAVVTELAGQRREMQAHMMRMHAGTVPKATGAPAGEDHTAHHPPK